MNFGPIPDAIHAGLSRAVFLMNMPESYTRTAFEFGMPLAGLLLLLIEWPFLKAGGLCFEDWCKLVPGVLFGGCALNCIGHLAYRALDAVCATDGARVGVRCASENEYALFPGYGGLLIHLALNATLCLWWWSIFRRQQRNDPGSVRR